MNILILLVSITQLKGFDSEMTEDAVSAVEQLIRLAEIRDVIFHEVRARRSSEQENEDIDLEVMFRENDRELGIRCRATVTAPGAEFIVDAEALFELEKPVQIQPEVVKQFVERVGVMVLYPYLRSAVSDAAAKLAVHRPVMRLLRLGDVQLQGAGQRVDVSDFGK